MAVKRLGTYLQLIGLATLLVTNPVSAWYCTMENEICSGAVVCECAGGHSCCDSTEPSESPCCIELEAEWNVLPGAKGSVVPEPASIDLPVVEYSANFDLPISTEREATAPFCFESPPPVDPILALFCVRLI